MVESHIVIAEGYKYLDDCCGLPQLVAQPHTAACSSHTQLDGGRQSGG